MKKTQKFSIILSLFCLSSCVFLTENRLDQTISENSFLNRFPENKKAIVILKLQGKKRDRIYLCQEKNVLIHDLKGCKTVYATNQYNIFMMEPASYYLFSKPENRPIFGANKIEEKQKYFAILNLNAGEIIYAGEIFYKQAAAENEALEVRTLDRRFVINDNFHLVENILNGKNLKQKDKLFSNQVWEVNYLINNYQKLESRFKKRLLESAENNIK